MSWLNEGITALISGMSAVFMILILISLMISVLGNVGKFEKKSIKEVPVHAKKASVPEASKEQLVDEQNRIVAAITVALSQELGIGTDRFVVRKFRRL